MKDLSNVKGAIFDLDGTLFDSMRVWGMVDEKFLSKRGIPLSEEYHEAVRTMHFAEAADYTIQKYNLQETPQAIMDEWLSLTQEAYETDVALKPYAKELLILLAQKGVKIGIATSSKPTLFLPVLQKHGVTDFFSSHTLTDEVARGKSFPDVYLTEAKRLGVAPCECAVFEDILIGIQGAKRGGFITVAMREDTAFRDEVELKRQADYYFNDFSEVIKKISP